MSKSEIKHALKEMLKDGTIKIEVHASYYDGATDSCVRIYIDNEQVYFNRD